MSGYINPYSGAYAYSQTGYNYPSWGYYNAPSWSSAGGTRYEKAPAAVTLDARAATPQKTQSAPRLTSLPPMPLPHHGPVPYSQAKQLLESGQVQRTSIVSDTKSLMALPTAQMQLGNERWLYTTLPRNYKDFTHTLEQNSIPYQYEAYNPSPAEKTKAVVTETMKETFVPILIFGLTAGVGWFLFRNVFRPMMEKGPIEDALRRSIKTFEDVNVPVDETLEGYDDKVQAQVNEFRRNPQKRFLIAQGPPGTGKTYLLEAVARERIKTGNVVCLDPGFDGRVRDLIYRVYGGDEVESRHAMKILEKMHGRPFDELLLVVNEMEQFPELNKTIVKALGNPPGKMRLPTLRILATSNQLPAFDAAVKSRVTSGVMYIDYTPVDKMTEIALKHFKRELPQFDKEAHRATVTEILSTNPGYSIRSVVDVLEGVSRDVKTAKVQGKQVDPVSAFQMRLFDRPLDDGEIAGLIRQVVNERLLNDRRVWMAPSQEGVDVLNRRVMNTVETFTDNLGVELGMNGRKLREIMEEALDEQVKKKGGIPTSPTNEFLKVMQDLANALRTATVLDGEKNEIELGRDLAHHFADFLEKAVKPESFPRAGMHQQAVSALRNPEPAPAVRDEMMEVAEYFAVNVKFLENDELKKIFAAACDPKKGGLAQLPEHHRNMARSLRKVLKEITGVKAA